MYRACVAAAQAVYVVGYTFFPSLYTTFRVVSFRRFFFWRCNLVRSMHSYINNRQRTHTTHTLYYYCLCRLFLFKTYRCFEYHPCNTYTHTTYNKKNSPNEHARIRICETHEQKTRYTFAIAHTYRPHVFSFILHRASHIALLQNFLISYVACLLTLLPIPLSLLLLRLVSFTYVSLTHNVWCYRISLWNL